MSELELVKHLRLTFTDRDGQTVPAISEAADALTALHGALSELADLMDEVTNGNYAPDSFTTQPARAALALVEKSQTRLHILEDGAEAMTADIIKRLQEGDGPDRELDAAIARNLGQPTGRHYVGDSYERAYGETVLREISAPFTASLDACRALQAKCLPGWGPLVNKNVDKFTVEVYADGRYVDMEFVGEHVNWERAWLIAILRAVEAQHD